jgi:hypothetical protein
MSSYDLAALAAQQGTGADLTLAPIAPTQTLEDDFARIYLAPIRSQAARLRDDVLPAYDQGHTEMLRGTLAADQSSMERDAAIAIAAIVPFMQRTEAWQVTRWGQVIKSATGVDLKPMLMSGDASKAIDAATERANAALNGNIAEFRKRVDSIVWNGLAQQKSRAQITEELKDALAIATRRAKTPRRTSSQVSSAN